MKKTLEQINAEAMSRRQALGRIGFLAGATAVAALTSDDLTRLVGREMQKRAGDNKIVTQVAKELQASGVTNANVVLVDDEDDEFDGSPSKCCKKCLKAYERAGNKCADAFEKCIFNDGSDCASKRIDCTLDADTAYDLCKSKCKNGC